MKVNYIGTIHIIMVIWDRYQQNNYWRDMRYIPTKHLLQWHEPHTKKKKVNTHIKNNVPESFIPEVFWRIFYFKHISLSHAPSKLYLTMYEIYLMYHQTQLQCSPVPNRCTKRTLYMLLPSSSRSTRPKPSPDLVLNFLSSPSTTPNPTWSTRTLDGFWIPTRSAQPHSTWKCVACTTKKFPL